MSSQAPYQVPESSQGQNQPLVETSPSSYQQPPPLPSAGFPQQPGMYLPASQYVGYPAVVAVPQQANGPGIASLVLGIIGVVTCFAFYIGLPVSLVGLALAIVGRRRVQGKGSATRQAGALHYWNIDRRSCYALGHH